LSLDQRAQILKTIIETKVGVKELVTKISGQRAKKTVSMIKNMHYDGLVYFKNVSTSKPGRPKKLVLPTVLGVDFLDGYNTLKHKKLYSKPQDLEHAKRDAAYTSRLKDRGLDPFKLFLELNSIANNIKVSSKAH
jgi:hypothetical protein